MGQLHEVLAVLPSCKGAAQKILEETRGVFAQKAQLFAGQVKKYEPVDEGGEEMPDERSPMSTTVGEKLRHLAEMVGPWLDAEYQVDATNMTAEGMLDVEGFKIALPATFLMQLDKRLSDLRKVYDAMPTLDPKHDWAPSADKGKGVYDAEDEIRNRTEKHPIHKVVWEPSPNDTSDRKPVIDKWDEDKTIGRFTIKRWSGNLSVEQKYEVLRRLDALQKATKRALSAANKTDHVTKKVSKEIFAFLHEGIALER